MARAAAPAWGVVAMDSRMLVGGAYEVRGSGSPSQPHGSRVARAAAPALHFHFGMKLCEL